MRTATVRDLRNNFARVSAWISSGQEVEITKRGEVMARLVPVAPTKKRKRPKWDMEARMKEIKEMSGGKSFPDNIVIEMRNEKDW
jgi:prevent-host-death family protein